MYMAIKLTIALKPNISIAKNSSKLWARPVRCFVGEEVIERQVIPLNSDLISLSSLSLSLSSLGSQYVTSLERPKVDMSQKSPSKSITSPSLDYGGGGGGMDDGGGNEGGVGGGNGSGGAGDDDDDYRLDDDNEDEPSGIFRSRLLVPEVFDKETLNAILKEWMKTMKELPLGLQQAFEMGALSSAKLTRFLYLHTRPTIFRLFTRLLPQELYMDFTSKIMADPSLPYKLCLEAVLSLALSLWWQLQLEDQDYHKQRGWPLVLTNTVTSAACNALFVWSLAPKNVFENSQYWQRLPLLSFFRKAVVFFALGFTAKASAQVISQEEKISIATVSKEALAAGLSLGLISNLRYHLICRIDTRLQLHFDLPTVSLAFCLALRFVNVAIGTQSLNWADASGVNNWFDFSFGLVDTTSTKSNRKMVLRKQKVRANI